ncbi:gp53-like domain-containing protein [Pantoea ananatis]|uniref:gp53-like domain-containing protein n=1 Tax=Pantoea ananas TaxID=553 RepID=UPI003CEED118
MQSLMPPIDSSDNLFHNGNPLTGEKGTIVTADFLNNAQAAIRNVQYELIVLLSAAQMQPDPTVNNQLFTALGKIFQKVNANLNALSGLKSQADKLPYFIGENAAAMADFTQVGRDIVGKASVADVLTYLGLKNLYQGLNDNLTALSGLKSDTDTLPFFFGPNKAAITPFTALARDIVGKSTASDLFKYLGIGSAANKNAGNGSGQLPDMSFFDSNFGVNGYQKLPSGLIIQWGSAPATIGSLSTKAYPIQFPNAALHVALTHNVANDANGIGISGADLSSSNTSQFTYKPQGIQISGNSVSAASAGSGAITFHFIAIGY